MQPPPLRRSPKRRCDTRTSNTTSRTGERGKRDVHTARLLAELAGAEAAIVVNNNAAAVFLVLNTLAKGAEVIVSRGELIEIGDGFRIPDIMSESGAVLREVGTTNRTRIRDYEHAISENTRLLLRVHPSNFRIAGFTERPSLEDLVALGRRKRIPVYEDLGSGCVADLAQAGIAEPVVRASCRAGAAVVTFSGDKLLGGPQAGIIAGKKEIVERIRRNPLFRALRVDKLTIAALEVTLQGLPSRRARRNSRAAHDPPLRERNRPARRILRAATSRLASVGRRNQIERGILRDRRRLDAGSKASPLISSRSRAAVIPPRRLKSASASPRTARRSSRALPATASSSISAPLFPDEESALSSALASALA